MTGAPGHQADITRPVHKYRPARALQSTAPTGSDQAAQGSFSIRSTHMESRVTAVEGKIRSLTSDVEGPCRDLGTVQHSVGHLETGQACGNSLMIRMLEGMGWSQEQIQQRLVQVGMSHSSSAPNLQRLPASQAPKNERVQAPLSTPMEMDPAKREERVRKQNTSTAIKALWPRGHPNTHPKEDASQTCRWTMQRDYYAHASKNLRPRNAERRGKPTMQSHRPRMQVEQAMDLPWTPQEGTPRSRVRTLYMKDQMTVTMILWSRAPRWPTVR